jgi:hypothetical protein
MMTPKFYQLQSGDNIIRLITNPFKYRCHSGFRANGVPDHGQALLCGDPDDKCPVCEIDRPTSMYMLGMVSRRDNQAYVLNIGLDTFKLIRQLATSRIWGDPRKYDLTITRHFPDYDYTHPYEQDPLTVLPHPMEPLDTAPYPIDELRCWMNDACRPCQQALDIIANKLYTPINSIINNQGAHQ